MEGKHVIAVIYTTDQNPKTGDLFSTAVKKICRGDKIKIVKTIEELESELDQHGQHIRIFFGWVEKSINDTRHYIKLTRSMQK